MQAAVRTIPAPTEANARCEFVSPFSLHPASDTGPANHQQRTGSSFPSHLSSPLPHPVYGQATCCSPLVHAEKFAAVAHLPRRCKPASAPAIRCDARLRRGSAPILSSRSACRPPDCGSRGRRLSCSNVTFRVSESFRRLADPRTQGYVGPMCDKMLYPSCRLTLTPHENGAPVLSSPAFHLPRAGSTVLSPLTPAQASRTRCGATSAPTPSRASATSSACATRSGRCGRASRSLRSLPPEALA